VNDLPAILTTVAIIAAVIAYTAVRVRRANRLISYTKLAQAAAASAKGVHHRPGDPHCGCPSCVMDRVLDEHDRLYGRARRWSR
jgi:hypothetical protein